MYHSLLLSEYAGVLIFCAIGIAMGLLMIIMSLLLGKRDNDSVNKVSTYECGFVSFGVSRVQFRVHYYIVALLFIIFDLEIAFMFPWAVTLGAQDDVGFWAMMIFLFILLLGFIYEWKKRALEWN